MIQNKLDFDPPQENPQNVNRFNKNRIQHRKRFVAMERELDTESDQAEYDRFIQPEDE